MRRLLGLLIAVALAWPAAGAGVGTTGAPFLRIPPLARPTGMGKAYTAIGGDLGSLHYNPGGLGFLAVPEVAFTHTAYIEGADFQYLAGGFRLNPEWTIAPFATRFGVEDVGRDANGLVISRFDNSDAVVGLSAAYRLYRDLSLGATVKHLRSELAQYHAQSTMLDVGVRYEYPFFPGLSFGASVTNIGGDLTFISQGDPLPTTGRLGLAYATPSGRSLWAFDIEVDREQNTLFHLGGEFRVAAPLILRTGFELGGASDRSFEEALKVGLGFESRVGTLDYAFESFDEFGAAHRFSYTYRFGEGPLLAGTTPEEAEEGRTSGFFGRLQRRGPSVAFGTFQNVQGTADLEWLERAFPDVFAARFRAAGIRVGPEGGARYQISGRFARLGPGRLWVSARLVDLEDNGRLVTFKDAVVGDEEVFRAAELLADEILPEIER